MAFDSSGTKAVWAVRLGTTLKRCERQLFFAGIRQAIWRYKAIHLGHLNMQFQQDWPKDEKITDLSIFWRKTYKNFARLSMIVRLQRDRQLFFAAALWAVRQWKAVDYLSWNMQFSAAQDVRLKNYRARSSFYRWPLRMGSWRDHHFYFNTAPWPVHHWKDLD